MKLKRLLLITAMLATIVVLSAVSSLAAEAKLAQVKASSLRLRSQPSLNASEVARIPNGATILIVDTASGGEWYKAVHNYTTGYVAAQYVTYIADADIALGDGLSTGSSVNVRKAPSTSADKITQLSKNQRVTVIGVSKGWFKVSVNGTVGYVSPDYLQIVNPSAASRSATTTAANDENEPEMMDGDGDADESIVSESAADSGVSGIRAEMVALAKEFLGCKYVYGGNGPKTFDCSGFTTYVYKKFGYSLNRSAAGQLSNGKSINKSELLPGDLVLFRDPKINKAAASHVGMYIGDNKFIHASSRGGGVIITSLGEAYYTKYFVGARRVL